MQKKLFYALAVMLLYAGTAFCALRKPKTLAEFNAAIREADEKGKPVIIKFYAESCPHCKKIKRFFDELSESLSNAMYIEIEDTTQALKPVAREHGIQKYPTIVTISSASTKKVTGADESKIKSAVQNAINEHAKKSPAKIETTKPTPMTQAQAPAQKSAQKEMPKKAASTGVHHPTTKAELNTLKADAQQEKKAIVIKFTTSWCSHCKDIATILDDMARELPNVVYIELDGDNKDFTDEKKLHGVTGYPTTIIMNTTQGTKEVIPGAAETPIKQAIRNAAAGKKVMSQQQMAQMMGEKAPQQKMQGQRQPQQQRMQGQRVQQQQKPMSRQERRAAQKGDARLR
jgi:thiol-disulfide isomerase/thioredoxin